MGNDDTHQRKKPLGGAARGQAISLAYRSKQVKVTLATTKLPVKRTKICECPKCGADITDTYEPADPSVGIFNEGWWCEECQLNVPTEADYDDHDD